MTKGLEGRARNMIRISTIFIAICMVLVAASLGLVLYSVAGISGTESAIVALPPLTFLFLYNAVSIRPGTPPASAGKLSHFSPATAAAQLPAVKGAVEANRIDLYPQPVGPLPQRKGRFYEAVTRLRDDRDQILTADDFIAVAEAAGLIGRIDHMVMLRCVQVLRRLMVRNKDVGVFCNVAAATLGNPTTFAQCLDFLEANRALAPSFVLEFKQATFRNLGPA